VVGVLGAIPDAKSVVRLPFLDLTSQAMDEEYFADGSPTHRSLAARRVQCARRRASYYYKGKSLPLAQIAQELRVAICRGSLRESGDTLRITARHAPATAT
jgi:TolB-like protein